MNRLCRQCHKTLPIERFDVLKEGRSWRRVCKTCRGAKYRKGTPPGPKGGTAPNGENINAATSEGRTCLDCQVWKPFDQFVIVKSSGNLFAYCNGCVSKRNKAKWANDRNDPVKAETRRQSNRRNKEKLRAEVLAAYGGRCVCCGEQEPMFLALDHVNNDGAAHRRGEGITTGTASAWSWARQHGYPDTLQLLCCNCNWGKHVNNGVCPHEANRRLAGKDYRRTE